MKADIDLLEQLAQSGQEVSLDLTNYLGEIYSHVYKATILHTGEGWFAQWLPKDCDNPKRDGWRYRNRPSQYRSWSLLDDTDGSALYKNLIPLSGKITLGGL